MNVAKHRFDNAKRRRPEHHARQAMLTPAYVLEPARAALGGSIGLDPCTDPDNPTRAVRFYAPPRDGADLPWVAESVWCNPPYGEARVRWVRRCIDSGGTRPTLLLIPASTETQISQEALAACRGVLFIKARLRFGVLRESGQQEAASHGSMLLGFGDVDWAPLAGLGVLFENRSTTSGAAE